MLSPGNLAMMLNQGFQSVGNPAFPGLFTGSPQGEAALMQGDFMMLLQGALNQAGMGQDAFLQTLTEGEQPPEMHVDIDALLSELSEEGLDVGALVESMGEDPLQNLEQLQQVLTEFLPKLDGESHQQLELALAGLQAFQTVLDQAGLLFVEDEGPVTPFQLFQADSDLEPEPVASQVQEDPIDEVLAKMTPVDDDEACDALDHLWLKKFANKPNLETNAKDNRPEIPQRISERIEQVLNNVLERVQNNPHAKAAVEQVLAKVTGAIDAANPQGFLPKADMAAPEMPKCPVKCIEQLQIELSLQQDGAFEEDGQPGLANTVLSVHGEIQGGASPEGAGATSDMDLLIAEMMSNKQANQTNGKSASINNMTSLPEMTGDVTEPPHMQVVQAARFSMKNGQSEMMLKLQPDSLGTVRLTLAGTAQNEVSIRLVADSIHAREVLESNMNELIRSLESNGLRIGNLSIVHVEGDSLDDALAHNQTNHGDHDDHQAGAGQNAHNNSNNGFSSQSSMEDGSDSVGATTDGNDASSTNAFDTDVEGEEVLFSSSDHDGDVDIRI